jgi:hypothetical protein
MGRHALLLDQKVTENKISAQDAANFRDKVYEQFCYLLTVQFYLKRINLHAFMRFTETNIPVWQKQLETLYNGLVCSNYCINTCASTWQQQKDELLQCIHINGRACNLLISLKEKIRNQFSFVRSEIYPDRPQKRPINSLDSSQIVAQEQRKVEDFVSGLFELQATIPAEASVANMFVSDIFSSNELQTSVIPSEITLYDVDVVPHIKRYL